MSSPITCYWRGALIVAALACSAASACADRVIITPSATALYADSARADIGTMLSATNPVTATHVNVGFQYLEVEAAEFHARHDDAFALGVQTQILPESQAFPNVSLGIRDIGNMTHRFGAGGYFGRSYYLVAGRTPVKFEDAPFPLRNLTTTIGIGGGAIHGFFGSLSSDFPLGLRGTLEWDSRKLNSRLTLPVSKFAQLEYSNEAGQSVVGLEIHRLTSF